MHSSNSLNPSVISIPFDVKQQAQHCLTSRVLYTMDKRTKPSSPPRVEVVNTTYTITGEDKPSSIQDHHQLSPSLRATSQSKYPVQCNPRSAELTARERDIHHKHAHQRTLCKASRERQVRTKIQEMEGLLKDLEGEQIVQDKWLRGLEMRVKSLRAQGAEVGRELRVLIREGVGEFEDTTENIKWAKGRLEVLRGQAGELESKGQRSLSGKMTSRCPSVPPPLVRAKAIF